MNLQCLSLIPTRFPWMYLDMNRVRHYPDGMISVLCGAVWARVMPDWHAQCACPAACWIHNCRPASEAETRRIERALGIRLKRMDECCGDAAERW